MTTFCKKSFFTFLALCLAIDFSLGSSCLSETLSEPLNWTLEGSAHLEGDSYVLTTASPRQTGLVKLDQPICAKSFKLSFDINLGTDISPLGGDGIMIVFMDEALTTQFRIHADTFFNPEEDPRYELDGNHVSIESLGAPLDVYGRPPISGNSTFGPFAAGKSPFTMEGSSWFSAEVVRNDRVVETSFLNGTAGLILKTFLPSDTPYNVIPGFLGLTKLGMNQQQIRNISFTILNKEGCPSYVAPLTTDQARAYITSSCGDVTTCPDETSFLNCVTSTTQALLTDERISSAVAELLELEAQYGLSFCSGYQQCETDIDPDSIRQEGYSAGYTAGQSTGYDSGYSAGDSSGYARGLTEGKAIGYKSGYASGDADGYTRGYNEGYDLGYSKGQLDGYDSGFSAGQTSGSASEYSLGYADGDETGFRRGYDQGFSSGEASGYQTGFDAGYKLGLTEIPECHSLSFDEAVEIITDSCNCPDFKNHGQWEVCTVKTIKELHSNSKISDEIRQKLFQADLKKNCSHDGHADSHNKHRHSE